MKPVELFAIEVLWEHDLEIVWRELTGDVRPGQIELRTGLVADALPMAVLLTGVRVTEPVELLLGLNERPVLERALERGETIVDAPVLVRVGALWTVRARRPVGSPASIRRLRFSAWGWCVARRAYDKLRNLDADGLRFTAASALTMRKGLRAKKKPARAR